MSSCCLRQTLNSLKIFRKQSPKVVHISPAARVTEFPQEFLTITTGKLFREVCHLIVMPKRHNAIILRSDIAAASIRR